MNCGETKPLSAFPYKHSSHGRRYFSHTCHGCGYRRAKARETEEQKEARRAYMRQYAKDNRREGRFKAYCSRHKRDWLGTQHITRAEAFVLMAQDCFYCSVSDAGGLDRIDCSVGYVLSNLRPCCEKCNNILGDLPDAAKLCLKEGLTRARKTGALDTWTIPTKR